MTIKLDKYNTFAIIVQEVDGGRGISQTLKTVPPTTLVKKEDIMSD